MDLTTGKVRIPWQPLNLLMTRTLTDIWDAFHKDWTEAQILDRILHVTSLYNERLHMFVLEELVCDSTDEDAPPKVSKPRPKAQPDPRLKSKVDQKAEDTSTANSPGGVSTQPAPAVLATPAPKAPAAATPAPKAPAAAPTASAAPAAAQPLERPCGDAKEPEQKKLKVSQDSVPLKARPAEQNLTQGGQESTSVTSTSRVRPPQQPAHPPPAKLLLPRPTQAPKNMFELYGLLPPPPAPES
jgi:hypothetical protein